MLESPLSRHAGLIVLTVGAYMAVTHVALLTVSDLDAPAAMLADPVFRATNLAYAAAFPGLAIALCAAYGRQSMRAGMFGLVAFGLAMVGTVALGADMWFEGFAAPWLAEVVPQVITAEKTAIWNPGDLDGQVPEGCAGGWRADHLLRSRGRPATPAMAVGPPGARASLASGVPGSVPPRAPGRRRVPPPCAPRPSGGAGSGHPWGTGRW